MAVWGHPQVLLAFFTRLPRMPERTGLSLDLKTFPANTRPGQQELFQYLLNDRGFRRRRAKYRNELTIAEWLNEPRHTRPVPAAADWEIAPIESVSA